MCTSSIAMKYVNLNKCSFTDEFEVQCTCISKLVRKR